MLPKKPTISSDATSTHPMTAFSPSPMAGLSSHKRFQFSGESGPNPNLLFRAPTCWQSENRASRTVTFFAAFTVEPGVRASSSIDRICRTRFKTKSAIFFSMTDIWFGSPDVAVFVTEYRFEINQKRSHTPGGRTPKVGFEKSRQTRAGAGAFSP